MTKLELQGLHPLFHSPLTLFEISDASSLNAQLVAEAMQRQATSPGLARSNRSGWHSEDDFFHRPEPGCAALRAHIVEALQLATLKVAPQFDLSSHTIQAEGWINVLGRGGLNTPHDHPAWIWSGCYYVQVPEGDDSLSGNIEFFDPRTNVRTLTVDGAACFASKFTVKPQAGMLLMFPSYLRHWVYPNDADQARITVAFNARYVRR